MGRGGARLGAGRKPKAEKYEREINRAERRIVDRLPQVVDNLLALADGGFEEIEEVYEPAGLIFVSKELITEDGRSINVKELAFPHLDPEQLVCVQRKRSIATRDRAANIYLADRIMGKPTQQTEISSPDGGPVETVVFTLDQWKAQAAARLATAATTFTDLADEGDDG